MKNIYMIISYPYCGKEGYIMKEFTNKREAFKYWKFAKARTEYSAARESKQIKEVYQEELTLERCGESVDILRYYKSYRYYKGVKLIKRKRG